MQVTKLINTPEGVYKFDADISEQDFNFIFNTGLNFLVARGAIPPQQLTKVQPDEIPAQATIIEAS